MDDVSAGREVASEQASLQRRWSKDELKSISILHDGFRTSHLAVQRGHSSLESVPLHRQTRKHQL